jgi:hypothetical protein
MNLEQLNSITVVPAASVWWWVAAVVVLIVVSVATGGFNPAMGVLNGMCFGALVAMPGFYFMIEATNDATNTAFHAELQKSYGLDTDATYQQTRQAAKDSRTVLLKQGNDILEVRPVVNGDVLTFLIASDGKPVAKANS